MAGLSARGPLAGARTGALARRPGPSVRTQVTEHLAHSTTPSDDTSTDLPAATRRHEDRLATEEPLEVRVVWTGVVPRRAWVTMRTPGHDFELATGWALHEGLLRGTPDGVAYCTDRELAPEQVFNVVTVTLPGAPARDPGHRHEGMSSGSSACGVCGKDSIDDVVGSVTASPHGRWSGALPEPAVVRELPDRLREHQSLFDRTGGVHAAGLFTAEGEALVVREDVGRHNAVDKVTGARLLAGASPAQACLVVSGRAGFELVQKAAAAGTGSLVSVGAPTSLAVDLARRTGLALYGFTSRRRTVQYC